MPKLEPPRDHSISLALASAHTRRHRDALGGPLREGDHAGAFHADQVLSILQQKGCVALRIYQGRNEKGHPAPVLVGVDANGNDLTSGVVLEQAFPCPPWCSDTNPLNS